MEKSDVASVAGFGVADLRTDGGNVSIPPVFVDMPNGTVTSDGLNSPKGIRRVVCDIWDIVRHGWKENGIEGETQEEEDDETQEEEDDETQEEDDETQEEEDDEPSPGSYKSTTLWMSPLIPYLQ